MVRSNTVTVKDNPGSFVIRNPGAVKDDPGSFVIRWDTDTRDEKDKTGTKARIDQARSRIEILTAELEQGQQRLKAAQKELDALITGQTHAEATAAIVENPQLGWKLTKHVTPVYSAQLQTPATTPRLSKDTDRLQTLEKRLAELSELFQQLKQQEKPK